MKICPSWFFILKCLGKSRRFNDPVRQIGYTGRIRPNGWILLIRKHRKLSKRNVKDFL